MSRSANARAQALTPSFDVARLRARIKPGHESKVARIADLVKSTEDKFEEANKALSVIKGDSSKFSKSLLGDLLSPARDVVNLLDAIADFNPAVKIVTKVAQAVIQLEIRRRDNEKQIAIVFVKMSDLLFFLCCLDPVFDKGGDLSPPLNKELKAVCRTIEAFGNFCEVYYQQNGFAKLWRSESSKEKLRNFATEIAKHKSELNLLLTAHSSLTITDVKSDVTEVLDLLKTRTVKEEKFDEMVAKMGGPDAVFKDEKKLEELAKGLGEKLDASIKRSLRSDLDAALKENQQVFSTKLDLATRQIQDSVEESTKTLLSKLEKGPHELIDDPDIKAVWQEMNARTSAKTRVFIDAVHNYYQEKFLKHEKETGEYHDDVWTLHFLSKIIFYPAIGDGIDGDSSGFISVQEVNTFINSKPDALKCSTAAWIAFWAVGPYKTDVEHFQRIQDMRRELTRAPSNVRKENKKRVQYFAAINKKLKLIDIYEDYLEVLGESDDDEDYEALEDLRQKWRRLEIKEIKSRLDQFHYRLQDIEYVKLVLGNRRLEHSILTLAYILLYRHMKIVKLARHKVISPQEFEDMRDTWESIFSAFETRFNVLVEMWRQQGRNLEIQSQCYCAGLFEDWYKRNLAYEDDYNMQDDSADDDDYYHDDDYSDVSDTEGEDSEPESEDGNGLRPPMRTNDVISVVSSAMSAGPTDPSRFLSYSGAAASEDDEGLTTDAESDWLPPAIRKRKAEEELRERLGSVQDRLTGVEERLGSIESMLREILVFQYGQASGGVGVAKNSRSPSKAPRHSLTQPPAFKKLLGTGGGAGDAPQSGVGEDQSDADANDSGEDSEVGHESTGEPLEKSDDKDSTPDSDAEDGQSEFGGGDASAPSAPASVADDTRSEFEDRLDERSSKGDDGDGILGADWAPDADSEEQPSFDRASDDDSSPGFADMPGYISDQDNRSDSDAGSGDSEREESAGQGHSDDGQSDEEDAQSADDADDNENDEDDQDEDYDSDY